MEKQTKNILIGALIIGILVLAFSGPLGLFAVTGNERVVRSMPSTVSPGATFSVTYAASGASGTWGASLVDAVSGGCIFPSGSTEYKTVMLSDDGNTKTIQVTAPQSGSCIFSGDAKFGDAAIFGMTNSVITVLSACTDTCASLGFTSGTHTICGTSVNCGSACVADSSCKANTCTTSTCTDICGNTYAGTKNCASCTDTCASLGFTSGTHTICGTSVNCGTIEPPTFDLNMVLFNIGTFAVTLKILLMGLGGLFVIKLVFGK